MQRNLKRNSLVGVGIYTKYDIDVKKRENIPAFLLQLLKCSFVNNRINLDLTSRQT